jgi:hypothetical protein
MCLEIVCVVCGSKLNLRVYMYKVHVRSGCTPSRVVCTQSPTVPEMHYLIYNIKVELLNFNIAQCSNSANNKSEAA